MKALSDTIIFEIRNKLLNSDVIRKLLYYNTADALSKSAPSKQLAKPHLSISPLEFMDEGDNQKLANFIVVYIPTIDFSYESTTNNIVIDILVDREQWELDENKLRLYQLVNEVARLLNKQKLSSAGQLELIDATYILVEGRFLGYQLSIDVLEERLENEFY